MNISFDGVGQVIATFAVDNPLSLTPGNAVTLTNHAQVGLGTAGDNLCGVITTVACDSFAGVQISGLAQVRYSGNTAPSIGFSNLTVDGDGAIVAASSGGAPFLVVSVDSSSHTAVIKL